MSVKLSKRAFDHAKSLVNEGRFVADERDDWSEHQPTAEQENESTAAATPARAPL